jgi:hypothetical protein
VQRGPNDQQGGQGDLAAVHRLTDGKCSCGQPAAREFRDHKTTASPAELREVLKPRAAAASTERRLARAYTDADSSMPGGCASSRRGRGRQTGADRPVGHHARQRYDAAHVIPGLVAAH